MKRRSGIASAISVRDKDGVCAAVLFAELAAACAGRGESVMQALHQLYRQYGLFVSDQKSLTLEGNSGARRVAELMAELRQRPPTTFGKRSVTGARDYAESSSNLPPSNVLSYQLEGGHGW